MTDIEKIKTKWSVIKLLARNITLYVRHPELVSGSNSISSCMSSSNEMLKQVQHDGY